LSDFAFDFDVAMQQLYQTLDDCQTHSYPFVPTSIGLIQLGKRREHCFDLCNGYAVTLVFNIDLKQRRSNFRSICAGEG